MAAKSNVALKAEQLALCPDNTSKFTTNAKMREMLENIVDSMVNASDRLVSYTEEFTWTTSGSVKYVTHGKNSTKFIAQAYCLDDDGHWTQLHSGANAGGSALTGISFITGNPFQPDSPTVDANQVQFNMLYEGTTYNGKTIKVNLIFLP